MKYYHLLLKLVKETTVGTIYATERPLNILLITENRSEIQNIQIDIWI